MGGAAFAQSAPVDPLTPTAAPSTAADCPDGINNCSLVTQDGTNLNTSVTQSGSGNVSDVDQINGSVGTTGAAGVIVNQGGTNATSYVLQSGTGIAGFASEINVVQSGDCASSTVRQLNTRNAQIYVQQEGDNTSYLEQGSGLPQVGDGSDAAIRQFGGAGNTAVAFQQTGNSKIGNVNDQNIIGSNGITQDGEFNNSEVYQLAGGRSFEARTDQVGDRNDSVLIQRNIDDNDSMRARITQTGDDNDSSVVQSGINGASNANFAGQNANIVQSGSDNLSRVEQENFSTGALTSSLQVIQNEDGNDSFIDQRSGSGRVSITQTSTDTSGIVTGTVVDNAISGGTDSVRANFSRVAQSGTGRTEAMLTQTGFGNLSDIRQNAPGAAAGLASAATVEQDGEDQSSFIEQNGTNDVAFVDQIGGSGNFSRIQQLAGGLGNEARIDQDGIDGESTVEQSGTDNTANLLQGAMTSDNISFITQSGTGNMADVFQTSSSNTSFVNQSGTDGNVTVTQGPAVNSLR